MDFGPLPTAQVVDCILGHTLRLPTGTLRKGRRLSDDDVRRIEEGGHSSVVVARLEIDDVVEGDAAMRLAASVCGPGVRCEDPFTGRTNLRAKKSGVVDIDVDSVTSLLRISEGLTLATLAPGSTVWADQLVATAKVIPFAVPDSVVREWEERASSVGPCIAVTPFRSQAVTFIQTQLKGTAEKVLDRASTSMQARLALRGSTLTSEVRCPHELSAVVRSLEAAISDGADLITILGASQIADRADVLPQAVVNVGGIVHRLGLSVDPGNLTMVASVGGITVLGVPGCARSTRPSGFDTVLDRALADVPPEEMELTALGVGGLLKEIVSRPQPRSGRSQPPLDTGTTQSKNEGI